MLYLQTTNVLFKYLRLFVQLAQKFIKKSIEL